ncbi:3-phosphoglycerate dehydrogenase [Phaeobacter italicus]|uniref:NAD(P)-dependent oxidoreductase n=1 Tax=Phaeobacter italicus TaxID=481446 RepID=UPI001ADA544F|nr:NAD(P)-dependent oxidoreductase [Phaeobacter italicus]MBO9443888.1 3-phosphoglycerate dehydrogenase [Phaeobacter italicus]
MPHVLVAGKLHPSGIALLDQADGVTYDYVEEISEESYAPLIEQADGLVIRTQPLSAETVARGKRLQIVSRHGVGYDAVDVEALKKRGVKLAVVGDVNSGAVAEHTMTLLLAASRRLLRYDQACRGERPWAYRNSLEAQEVDGKTLLIVGYGRIGRKLASMASAFGMKIAVFDPFLVPETLDSAVLIETNLHDAFKRADFISFHMPPGDKPLLGKDEIASLKPNCVVLNAARGGIVDDIALADALKNERILGAGVDVFAQEPPAPDHPYHDVDTAVLTPHSAGMSLECAERMAIRSVQNVLDHFAERLAPELVVNT